MVAAAEKEEAAALLRLRAACEEYLRRLHECSVCVLVRRGRGGLGGAGGEKRTKGEERKTAAPQAGAAAGAALAPPGRRQRRSEAV